MMRAVLAVEVALGIAVPAAAQPGGPDERAVRLIAAIDSELARLRNRAAHVRNVYRRPVRPRVAVATVEEHLERLRKRKTELESQRAAANPELVRTSAAAIAEFHERWGDLADQIPAGSPPAEIDGELWERITGRPAERAFDGTVLSVPVTGEIWADLSDRFYAGRAHVELTATTAESQLRAQRAAQLEALDTAIESAEDTLESWRELHGGADELTEPGAALDLRNRILAADLVALERDIRDLEVLREEIGGDAPGSDRLAEAVLGLDPLRDLDYLRDDERRRQRIADGAPLPPRWAVDLDEYPDLVRGLGRRNDVLRGGCQSLAEQLEWVQVQMSRVPGRIDEMRQRALLRKHTELYRQRFAELGPGASTEQQRRVLTEIDAAVREYRREELDPQLEQTQMRLYTEWRARAVDLRARIAQVAQALVAE